MSFESNRLFLFFLGGWINTLEVPNHWSLLIFLPREAVKFFCLLTQEHFASVSNLAALIAEACFDDLDAPVKRVASKDVPMPFSQELEKLVVPTADTLVGAARELLG